MVAPAAGRDVAERYRRGNAASADPAQTRLFDDFHSIKPHAGDAAGLLAIPNDGVPTRIR